MTFDPQSPGDLLLEAFGRVKIKPPPKPDHVFRVSSIPKLCPREEVIACLEGLSRPDLTVADSAGDPLDAAEAELKIAEIQFAAAVGTALHGVLQNEVFAGVLLGRWRCKTCSAIHENEEGYGSGRFVPRPVTCDRPVCRPIRGTPSSPRDGITDGIWVYPPPVPCTGTDFEFVETTIENLEAGWRGRCDGALQLDAKTTLEIKGMGLWPFTKQLREGLLLNYRIQGSIYMDLSGYHQLVVLAVARNLEELRVGLRSKRSVGIEAFVVQRDNRVIDDAKRLIHEFRVHAAAATLPPRPCQSADCERAIRCPLRKQCFELPND